MAKSHRYFDHVRRLVNCIALYGIRQVCSLVPRPLLDFISQLWRKIRRRPGIKTMSQTGNGGLGLSKLRHRPETVDLVCTDRKRWSRFVKTTSQTGNGGLGLSKLRHRPETVDLVCTDRKRWSRFVKTTSQTGNGGLCLYVVLTNRVHCFRSVT